MESNLKIKQYGYNKDDIAKMLSLNSGKNWPHVYLIHDDKKLYVGETQSIYTRTKQHLDLDDVDVSTKTGVIDTIFDDSFNKSAVLDIEQSLIQLFSADNNYKLLNRNGGQSCLHNYYQKDYYHNELVSRIWDELYDKKIVKKPIYYLQNTDIFKYSPYVSLTEDQLDVCERIINNMLYTLPGKTGTFVVSGVAGSGKTVLSVYLLSILQDLITDKSDAKNNEDYDDLMTKFNLSKSQLRIVLQKSKLTKIGFVVPMKSLRDTLKEVFKAVGLKHIKVIGPDEAVTNDYDILFVDEAHRLFHKKNIVNHDAFQKKSELLGLKPEESNQLQWIMKKSKYCVLFYDKNQTVRGSDITEDEFDKALKMHDLVMNATLTSQLRCLGGADYIEYIDNVLHCEQEELRDFGKYPILLFDKIRDLIDVVAEKEQEYGLSRIMAGYGWKWVTSKPKNQSYEQIKASGRYDIDIEGVHLIWNTKKRWICSEHAKDEVGCIHTTQGFDLNYAGIIFGPEIDYDPIKKEIVVIRNKFYDRNAKAGVSDEDLKKYIINAYAVMLKRGIKGTYIYAVNNNLKEYLNKFFVKYNPQNN